MVEQSHRPQQKQKRIYSPKPKILKTGGKMYKGKTRLNRKSHENIIGSLAITIIILIALFGAFTYALTKGIDSRDAYYCRTAISTGNTEYLNEYCGAK